ncbi:MAG: erythromycin esterase family protein, partial [Candidatus Krumholzibacteria bacterium]|nr:erythromycin esterase family protein [Candidatus Krumholzibacteria bacterium]
FFLRWVPAARIVAPNLGNHLHRRHGDDYYALGLSMAGGRMGAPGGRTGHARPPRRNSLEYLLARGGSRAAFLDLARPAPGGDIFRNTRVQMLDSALYWRWIVSAEQYDGVLVVRDVTPARYLH